MEPFIKVLQAQNIQHIYIKTIDYTTKHCMCYFIIVYQSYFIVIRPEFFLFVDLQTLLL